MSHVKQIRMLGNIPRMTDGWRQRLADEIKRAEIPWKRLSKSLSLNETYIRDVLKRGNEPTVPNLVKICDQLGISPSLLFDGQGPPKITINRIGHVSAGESWTPVDDYLQGGGEPVEIDFHEADPIIIGIRGTSMEPVYRNGDDLICSRRRGADVDQAVGKDCVVMTADDEAYVKKLLRGRVRGLYRLRSYNDAYADIDDVRVQWVAPVVWIRRRQY